jgi:Tfp pilus assembly protein FimT
MRVFVLAAIIAALATPGLAQHLDSKGQCRTAGGKAVKASLCAPKTAKPDSDDGMKARPLKCHDIRSGAPTKCGGAYAVPSPVN